MKKFLLISLAFILVLSFCACNKAADSNTPVDEKAAAKTVIENFFKDFKNKDFDKMRDAATDNLKAKNTDPAKAFEAAVFGMQEATLTSCEFDTTGADKMEEGALVFICNFDFVAAPGSVSFGSGETKTTFYIEMVKEDGKWKLNDFFTGY